jgi:hypothetical protein
MVFVGRREVLTRAGRLRVLLRSGILLVFLCLRDPMEGIYLFTIRTLYSTD